MNLSFRLTEVKNMVTPCGTACDIGCDHGYVSMALIKEGKAEKVIACDVNKGPLEAARKNIEAENLEDYIETRLGDGLHKITPEDCADAVIIAGMGGKLMERILSERPEVIVGVNQLVLQPQSEIFLIRKWIRNNGFYIESEKALVDDGKYYFIINAKRGDSSEYSLVDVELFDTYSKYLIEKKDSVLRDYLTRTLQNNLSYMEGIKEERKSDLLSKNRLILQALDLMKE